MVRTHFFSIYHLHIETTMALGARATNARAEYEHALPEDETALISLTRLPQVF